ncbi:hypothetical protein ES705_28881 [subsurface metagenome]
MLISRGNSKLGKLPSFSLPVITTCPGKTAFCNLFCYGFKGMFILPSVKDVNERRLDASLKSDFVPIIIKEIQKTRAPAFRLHVIGDFYMPEYIEKWNQIATELTEVAFFGSTRSWRCDYLIKPLEEFRDLPNVYMKASIDATDFLDPFSCGWRVWSIEGKGVPCPHDSKMVEDCLACGRCWTHKDTDTSFRLRWGHQVTYLALAFKERGGINKAMGRSILSLHKRRKEVNIGTSLHNGKAYLRL